MISVNDPRHRKLEADVIRGFRTWGWKTEELTYHESMRPSAKEMLSRNGSLSAFIVRTRNDRVSFDQEGLIAWDAKTTTWKSGNDFPIEVVPLLSMIFQSMMGLQCMLFCRRLCGEEFVFNPVDAIPAFQRILVPSRGRSDEITDFVIDWTCEQCDRAGIECDVFATDNCSGTGDPFAAIDPELINPSFNVSEFFESR